MNGTLLPGLPMWRLSHDDSRHNPPIIEAGAVLAPASCWLACFYRFLT
jgi:hypothetical protein